MARAWMVRAGRDGERQAAALAESCAFAGWGELGDLSNCSSREQIRDVLREIHGTQFSPAVIGNWSGQLWRFVGMIQEGDVIVMPLKGSDDAVAMGWVTGPYSYDASQEEDMRHSRPVRWARPQVSKNELRSDLLASLGSLLTICELSRREAATRLARVADGEPDLGWNSPESEPLPKSLSELVNRAPLRLTIRELLDIWHYRRRTDRIVKDITDGLDELGLLAVPSISDGWIDGAVEIIPMPGLSGEALSVTSRTSDEVNVAEATAEAVISGSVRYSVSTMHTAHCDVLTARPEDLLSVAVTRMALKDYSQVAVVDDNERLIGALTWESIALAWMSGAPTVVRDAMRSAPSAAPEDELLLQASVIYHQGFVFVRNRAGTVQGIVTSADLSRRFGDDHRPIVLLDEIERGLGSRIHDRCTDEVLRKHGVKIKPYGATFGNYVAALSKTELWDMLGWSGLGQTDFHAQMERVRGIRNQLMHFSPDPITPEEVELLEKTARFLRLVTDGER